MKTVCLFPSHFLISMVSNLKGSCSIFSDELENYSKLFLGVTKSRAIEVLVDYQDVNFKFECFGLKLNHITDFSNHGLFEIDTVNFSKIKYCIRHEWERSYDTESNQQTVRESGLKCAIPSSADFLCSSLVSFVFYDQNNQPIFLLYHDINDTVEIRLTRDIAFIKEFLGVHDVYDIKDLSPLKE